MKIWTYAEMVNKVELDLDLKDETFIDPDEMRGYFNEALTEAESEIMVLNQEYFLAKYFVPFVQGNTTYNLPENLFANKIRAFIYKNNSIIYPIVQYRRKDKFQNIALTEQYGPNDDYRYLIPNEYPGQRQLEIHPKARETAILAPYDQKFTPAILWFIRNCNRVPLLGEYCNPELVATTQVDIGADTIQTYAGTKTIGIPSQGLPGAYPGSIAYKTGDAVQFSAGPNGILPAPLVEGTIYYVIAQGAGLIKLATSKANALANVAIDLTTVGTVYFTIKVAATLAIINATLMDIPEFATFVMQWVKCRCMEKEGDPRLAGAIDILAQQKKQMVDTLTEGIVDDDNEIQPDYTHYQEMS